MDNSGKEKEAMALIAEAEKKMRSSQSFFGSLFGCVCHGVTVLPILSS